MKCADKYETAKAEITVIYHENKGRYGYRRITAELHSRKIRLNHKTVQRLMKQLGLRALSADFTELLTIGVSPCIASRSIRAGVSGRYPLIPPIGF